MTFGDRGTRTAAAAAAVSVLGFLLPMMLIARLESLLKFLDPLGVVEAYGAAFAWHVPLALAAAALAAAGARLAGRGRIGRALPSMVLVTGFALAVWMGARPLLEARIGQQPSPFAIAAVLALAGGLVGYLRAEAAARAMPAAAALTGLGALAALFALGAARWEDGPPERPPADPARPDILVITMDALADGHLSSRGYPRPTSLRLDEIATDAVQFTHLVAASNYTTPTLNSLLTGRSALGHGAWHLRSRPWAGVRARSLPAILHGMGYSVRAVTTNANGGVYRNGYDPWFDVIVPDAVPALWGCRDDMSRWLREACVGADLGIVNSVILRLNAALDLLGWWEPGRHFDARIGLAAADRLFRRGEDGRPVAVWVHLSPPHDPYVAPGGYVGRFDASPQMRSFWSSQAAYQFAFAKRQKEQELFRARYDESVAAVTDEVAAFVARLRREGRLSGAILLISADHGQSFTPDYGGHGGPKLHDPLIRIPLLLFAPGLPAGLRIDTPVSQIDLAPTLIALAGGTPPADMEGRSLLPLIAGREGPVPVLAWALERANRRRTPSVGSAAIIDGRWKYVHYWNQPDMAGYRDLADGLYDLAADPGETRNLAGKEPRRAAAMRAEIRRRLAAYRPGGRTS